MIALMEVFPAPCVPINKTFASENEGECVEEGEGGMGGGRVWTKGSEEGKNESDIKGERRRERKWRPEDVKGTFFFLVELIYCPR